MSSGKAYPMPTYIPPLSVFNPLFFPQTFSTTTSGGGGGQTNIFPQGLTSGNVITMNGGTGGGGGTGVERTITGLSQIEWVDINSTNPTDITGYMVLDGNTLNIGSANSLSGINVNLLGSIVSANGTPIATGGNVSNNQSNTFQNGFTQTFQGEIIVDNTQSNIGQYSSTNTGLGLNVFTNSPTGIHNVAIGTNVLSNLTTGNDNTGIGWEAGLNMTTGINNTFVGIQSLLSVTSGFQNTAFGLSTLSSITTDSNNTGIGYEAGYNLIGNGSNSSNNTFLGYRAGFNQITGNNNVSIGYNSGVDTTTPNLNNTIAIGNQITSVATGDIIFGFKQFFNSADYWVKITPNTTSGLGIQLQGTYNSSSNITISSPSVNVTNILTTPNNPTITTTNLSNGQGSFYVDNQLPYFAYNNSGTITSQQLSTTTNNILFTINTSGASGTEPGIWTFTLPNNTYPQQFYYYAYLNNNLTPTQSSIPQYAVGSIVTNTNGSNYFAFGLAVATIYNTAPAPTITPGYGYIFNVISALGLPNLSIQTISQANNLNGTTTYNLYSTGASSTFTFTIVGVSIP